MKKTNEDYINEESLRKEEEEVRDRDKEFYIQEPIENKKDNSQIESKSKNEIINEYIERLENNTNSNHNDNNYLKEEDEEDEDEFEKAEATYKQSQSNKKETEQEYQKEIKQISKDKRLTKPLSKKSQNLSPNKDKGFSSPTPGYLYYKENESIYKKQLVLKNKAKVLEPLHFKNNEYYQLYHHDFKHFSRDKNSNERLEHELLLNKITSPKQTTAKSNKTVSKLSKGNKVLQSLFDPLNPYSNIWPNSLLRIQYNSKLHIDRFANGVPKFSIQKLNKHSYHPSVRSYSTLLYHCF